MSTLTEPRWKTSLKQDGMAMLMLLLYAGIAALAHWLLRWPAHEVLTGCALWIGCKAYVVSTWGQ